MRRQRTSNSPFVLLYSKGMGPIDLLLRACTELHLRFEEFDYSCVRGARVREINGSIPLDDLF